MSKRSKTRCRDRLVVATNTFLWLLRLSTVVTFANTFSSFTKPWQSALSMAFAWLSSGQCLHSCFHGLAKATCFGSSGSRASKHGDLSDSCGWQCLLSSGRAPGWGRPSLWMFLRRTLPAHIFLDMSCRPLDGHPAPCQAGSNIDYVIGPLGRSPRKPTNIRK